MSVSTPYEKNTSLKHLWWCVISALSCWFTNLLRKCFLRILSIEYFYYFLSAWYLVAIYFCKDLFFWEWLWLVLCRYTFASNRFPKKNCRFKFANLNLARIRRSAYTEFYEAALINFDKTLSKTFMWIYFYKFSHNQRFAGMFC